MSASALCPTCSDAIDPARAPVARIRGSRVLTFCSAACADGQPAASATGDPVVLAPKRLATSNAVTAAPPLPQPGSGAVSAPMGAAVVDDTGGLVDPESGELDLGSVRLRRGGRRHLRQRVIALSAVIVVGGMAIAIIDAVAPSSPSPAGASRDALAPAVTTRGDSPAPARVPALAEAPADVQLTPEALLAAAERELTGLLASDSMRVRRIAALALARTGDAGALDVLREALSDRSLGRLARIQMAYALARAADAPARKVLVESLSDDSRDVRLDAARALVWLGDDAGRKVLRRMLRLKTHRLGAAELLAMLGDDEGTEALREAIEDSSQPEAQMRAVVALGRAGDDSVRATLHEILGDGRYTVGAAEALAMMGDKGAVGALQDQLGVASLRVRAAVSLRRLGVEVDLEPLAQALVADHDVSRVSAAEAIVVLVSKHEGAQLR